MLWLWILLGILALFLLFCLLRVGIYVAFQEKVSASIIIGPLRIQVVPAKPKKKKKKEEKPKPKPEKKSPTLVDKLKKIPKPTVEDLKSAYHTLWPPTKRAIRRTRRGILVNPLEVSLTLGGREDPAVTAEMYGLLHSAIWTGMPVLERLLVIPHPGIHLGVDFDREKPEVRGQVGLSIRIGTILLVGLGVGIPALKWFLQYLKRHKTDKKTQKETPEEPPKDAAA